MIERYSRDVMRSIWSEENKFQKMLDIEILACESLAQDKIIPAKALATIKKKAAFNVLRIKEIEKKTGHDVVAFIENVSEKIGPDAKYIHMGLTSSDVLDTSLSSILKESSDILINDIKNVMSALKDKAKLYKNVFMIGRTHGVHAEPITFGLKMALFYDEFSRNLKRLEDAKENISVGKISGSVGTYVNVTPKVEEYVCKKLGLLPAKISTQILQRDRHAHFLCCLALIGSSCQKLAMEIRHLHRTEVQEAQEYFSKTQKGSSSMPHKKNPILCERICGLARLLQANSLVGLENIALWHERDISHSSAERIVLPDSTILLDYMLSLLANIIENLIVHKDNMLKNINLTNGLIFSQRVLLKLISKGMSRLEAYDIVQKASMRVYESKNSLKQALLENPKVKKCISIKELDLCFDLKDHMHHIEYIYKRVGIN